MAGLFGWGRRRAQTAAGAALFDQALAVSRQPWFFAPAGAPDTVEGRFESVMLQVALILRALKARGPAAEETAQVLFDALFEDADAALREIGVGDLVVGKRIKRMAEAFYGRLGAYDAALSSADPQALIEALQRNLYVDATVSAERLAATAAWIRARVDSLEAQALDDLLAGRAPAPPAPPLGVTPD